MWSASPRPIAAPRTLPTERRKLISSAVKVLCVAVCVPRTPNAGSRPPIRTLKPLTIPCSWRSGGPLKRSSVRRSGDRRRSRRARCRSRTSARP